MLLCCEYSSSSVLYLATYYLGPGSRPCPCPVCSPTCGSAHMNKALSVSFGYNSCQLSLCLSLALSLPPSHSLHPIQVRLCFPFGGCNLICRKVWTVILINNRPTGHQASVDARVSVIDPNAGPCISSALADPASSFGPFNDPQKSSQDSKLTD